MSRFQMVAKLGEGSMGIVCHAYDRERAMEVALKTLRHPGAGSLYRFKREFRSLASMSHPNIVRLYELINERNTWYFTMELVHGMNLMAHLHPSTGFDDDDETTQTSVSAIVQPAVGHESTEFADSESVSNSPGHGGETVPVHEIVDISRLRTTMAQLATALHALHGAGLVHRDLKPENVRITDQGRVVLMDFGLVAHAARSGSGHVAGIAGTPAYMAPELLDRVRPTPAADWYGFGALLFEALTMSLPFSGTLPRVMAAKRQGDAPSPSVHASDIPDDLRELCERLLARDPVQRPTGTQVLEYLGVAHTGAQHVSRDAARHASCFVGRASELEVLRASYRAVCQGAGVCVLIEGPSGMGKSRLLDAFVAEVCDAGHENGPIYTFTSRCHERELLPYKPLDGVVDDISQVLRMLPEDERDGFIPDGMESLTRLFPVLGRVPHDHDHDDDTGAPTSTPDHVAPREEWAHAVAALRSLLERMALERPLVICIEALQWADDDGLHVLCELLGAAPIAGALVLMTARSAPWSAPLAHVVEILSQKGGHFERLCLGPLSRSEEQTLVAHLTTHPKRVAAIDDEHWQEFSGHPVLLTQLARYLDEVDPADDQVLERAGDQVLGQAGEQVLGRVVGRRIERMSSTTREMLETLAVLDEPVAQQVLQKACCLSSEVAERSVTTLCSQMLARVSHVDRGLWLDCYHDKIRAIVLDTLAPERRQTLHRWVAHTLKECPDVAPTTVAYHFAAGGAPEDAGEQFLRAARLATTGPTGPASEYATEQAAEWYRQVITLLADASAPDARAAALCCRAHIGLAEGMKLTDRTDEALNELALAGSLARRHDLFSESSEIHYKRGDLYFLRGDVEGCVSAHQRAREYEERAHAQADRMKSSARLIRLPDATDR